MVVKYYGCTECTFNTTNEFLSIPDRPGYRVCICCLCIIPAEPLPTDVDSTNLRLDAERVDGMLEHFACRSCNGRLVITKEGDRVCAVCALVVPFCQIYDRACDMPRKFYKTYKRMFYFNERISQFNRTEPEIDPFLRDLLYKAYIIWCGRGKIKEGEIVPYEITRKICRSVSVEYKRDTTVSISKQDSIEYGSHKFKRKPIKNLLYLAEKWITLNKLWTGKYPPYFDSDIILRLRLCYAAYQAPFEQIRHSDQCLQDRSSDKYQCHKSKYKCRYAMVNINLLMSIFLLKCELDEDGEEYKTYMEWWPQLNINKRLDLVKTYILPIESFLHGKENKYKFIPRELRTG